MHSVRSADFDTPVLSLLSRDNLRALPGPFDVIHTRQLVCFAIRTGMSLVLDEVGQLSTY